MIVIYKSNLRKKESTIAPTPIDSDETMHIDNLKEKLIDIDFLNTVFCIKSNNENEKASILQLLESKQINDIEVFL